MDPTSDGQPIDQKQACDSEDSKHLPLTCDVNCDVNSRPLPLHVSDQNSSGDEAKTRSTNLASKPKSKGIYVQGSVCDIDAICCIDTGASSSLVSIKLYESIPETQRPSLDSTSSFVGADGSPIKCLGVGKFSLGLGRALIDSELIVADITDDILIGADVLQDPPVGPVIIDLVKEKITLQGLSIPIVMIDGQHRFRKVVAADFLTIPAKSEAMVDVHVDRDEDDERNKIVMIEQSPTLSEKWNLALAACLVDVGDSATVKIRLLNPCWDDVIIPPYTILGYAQPYKSETIPLFDTESDDTCNRNRVRRIKLCKSDIQSCKGNKRKHCKKDSSVTFNRGNSENPTIREVSESCDVPAHVQDLFQKASEGHDQPTKEELAKLLIEFQDVFSRDKTDLGRTHLGKHYIHTNNAKPVKLPPRRVPLAFEGEEKAAIEQLVQQGSIRPSTSPWASPIVMVRKRDGTVRPCIDYRRLNAVTVQDAFPLPRTEDCLDAVSGSVLFSTLDITSAYNQIPVNEEDIYKTAFVTKYGLYEYTTMPFGLCNAPSTFQRIIELALRGLQWITCLIYLDDVIIFGRNFKEHLSRLKEVLLRIRRANLKLKPSKCHLLQEEVEFLGHVVSEEEILPNPRNIEKLLNWPRPVNTTQVRGTIGLGSYYRRFVKDFSKLVHPLTELIKKDKPFKWTDKCEEAFQKLKEVLTGAEVMGYPKNDCQFVLDTDACDISLGAVLSQIQAGRERVIGYASRTLSSTERNYCVTDKELLAVVNFVQYYRHYLLGRQFLVRTDHQALK